MVVVRNEVVTLIGGAWHYFTFPINRFGTLLEGEELLPKECSTYTVGASHMGTLLDGYLRVVQSGKMKQWCVKLLLVQDSVASYISD